MDRTSEAAAATVAMLGLRGGLGRERVGANRGASKRFVLCEVGLMVYIGRLDVWVPDVLQATVSIHGGPGNIKHSRGVYLLLVGRR